MDAEACERQKEGKQLYLLAGNWLSIDSVVKKSNWMPNWQVVNKWGAGPFWLERRGKAMKNDNKYSNKHQLALLNSGSGIPAMKIALNVS